MLTVALIATSLITFAQDGVSQPNKLPAFKKGSSTIAIGAGFGYGRFDYYGTTVGLPMISVAIERAVVEVGPGVIGAGAIAGYKFAKYDYSTANSATWHDIVVAARATYHLTLLKDLNNHFDPYGGVTIGGRYNIYDDTYYNSLGYNPYSYNDFGLIYGLFVGAKYNFSRWFGVFVELGYDITPVRFGINFNELNN